MALFKKNKSTSSNYEVDTDTFKSNKKFKIEQIILFLKLDIPLIALDDKIINNNGIKKEKRFGIPIGTWKP